MAEHALTIALAGNPNSGKTTVFNAITGSRQHVANYPGVTVEHKEGACVFEGRRLRIIDLPGTYSLSAQSADELVARNFIVDERPDVVVAIVDSSNLERNLYLVTQIMELGAPLVLAFNMSDLARSLGYQFDYRMLSELLGTPIVPTVGHRGEGIDELIRTAVEAATADPPPRPAAVRYGRDINRELAALTGAVEAEPALGHYPPAWLALKLLENDSEIHTSVEGLLPEDHPVLTAARQSVRRLERIFNDEPEVVIAEARYGFISGACGQAVESTVETRHAVSDRIDKVLTNRLLGIPIFLALTWLVFQLTFTLGEPPMGWIESGFGWLGSWLTSVMSEGYLRSLLVDGVIAGVGGVLVFLPNILLLFMAIAFLEDSGYMARAAFIMDRLMTRIGLQGRSFIPLLIGFGCTVPAVMATRTLSSRRDRLVTMLIAPLMSCGARLPVYILLAGAFFRPEVAGNVIFSVYLLGILMAVVMAKLFRKVVLPGPPTPFVLELPPYRLPTLRGVLIHMWERGWLYLKKAGTVILAISIVIWALSTFPRFHWQDAKEATKQELAQKQLEHSYAGRVGSLIAPVLRPAGLGNWKIGTALFAGFGAKEVVVSTLGTLYGLGETDEKSDALRKELRNDMTPLQGYALMVFVLLYIPCLATVAVIKRESGSWKWPLFTVAYTTVLAWVVSTVVYQIGSLLGLG